MVRTMIKVKTMKTHSILAIIFLALTGVLSAADPILELIAKQQKTLNDQGISGFVEVAKIEQWSAPRVKSKWAIERTADRVEQARLVAYFELGRNLLLALPQLVESNDKPSAMGTVIRMTDFADWVAAQQCYGNALIAKRALDLALPLAGQLVIDPNASQETFATLEKHLKPIWAATSFCASVLDGEAKSNLFSVAKTNEDIRSIWREGVRKAMEKADPNWAKSLPVGFLKAPSPHAVPIGDEIIPFFRDDPLPPMPTTEALLEGKYHEVIAIGVEPVNAARLRDLIKFREALKGFPSGEVKSEFYPGLKGAFDEAWRKHYQAKRPKGMSVKLGLAAWSTYDAIKQKQMLPEDEAQALNR